MATVRKKKKKTSPKPPTSKATNAYDLLTDVERLILAEPKRYNQGLYLLRQGDSAVPPEYTKFPACGTVACVAGWVATLKATEAFDSKDADEIACDVLGIDSDQADELFQGDPPELVRCNANSQTLAYAKAGVRHIRAFKKLHAAQLKAKAV